MTDTPFERTRPITDYLYSIGAWILNVKGGANIIGCPDILACLPPGGRLLAVEVKRSKGGRLSQLQRVTLMKLKALGALTVVATSVADVRQIVEPEIHSTTPAIDGKAGMPYR
jgi:hypothetical protein